MENGSIQKCESPQFTESVLNTLDSTVIADKDHNRSHKILRRAKRGREAEWEWRRPPSHAQWRGRKWGEVEDDRERPLQEGSGRKGQEA